LILDLSKALVPTDLAALRAADHILLVAQLDLASLRNVVRLLMALGHEDGLSEKVRIVMIRVGADYAEAISVSKRPKKRSASQSSGRFRTMPKPMIGSRVNGVPLIQFAPKCRAQQSIAGLAQAVFGTSDLPWSSLPDPLEVS